MPTLEEIHPVLGLCVTVGDLELRGIDDATIPGLVGLVLGGVHEPGEMPFSYPWTEAPRDRLPLNTAQHFWRNRAAMTADLWELDLAVRVRGELVGVQSVRTRDFRVLRSGETGSWLGLRHHGGGVGTRMRQAICALCFDHLGFEQITSCAYGDNPASQAVSRKVGYRPNGLVRSLRRDGTEWAPSHRYVLTPETFVRGEPIQVAGVEAVRSLLGIE